MSNLFKTFFLFLVVLLSGCFGDPYRRAAPVIETSPQPLPAESSQSAPPSQQVNVEEDVQIAAYRPPVQVRAEPVNTGAVAELIKTADRQQQAGDMTGAAATVERALRIEPRNAYLWNKLAHVRMNQGQARQAADLAAKSNSLAGADRWLRHNNWQLIGQAKRKVGDLDGARQADLKAASLR